MFRSVVLATVVVMLGGSLGFADDTKAQAQKYKSAEKTIKERMSKVVDSIVYEEMPLSDVVEDLKAKLDVPILVDVKALDEASITPDQPITISLPKIRVDLGLKLMLDPLELTVDYSKGLPIITTNEKARTIVRTQYYDVRDLIATIEQEEVKRRKQFGGPSPDAKSEAAAESPEAKLSDSINVNRAPAMMSAKDQAAKPAVSKSTEFHPSETVRKLVMDTVEPTSWQEKGGPGRVTILAGVMVVVQTSDAQDEIEELLSQVRAIMKMPPGAQPSTKPTSAEAPQPAQGSKSVPKAQPSVKPVADEGTDDPFGAP
jgi:hypothetical protein